MWVSLQGSPEGGPTMADGVVPESTAAMAAETQPSVEVGCLLPHTVALTLISPRNWAAPLGTIAWSFRIT